MGGIFGIKRTPRYCDSIAIQNINGHLYNRKTIDNSISIQSSTFIKKWLESLIFGRYFLIATKFDPLYSHMVSAEESDIGQCSTY